MFYFMDVNGWVNSEKSWVSVYGEEVFEQLVKSGDLVECTYREETDSWIEA